MGSKSQWASLIDQDVNYDIAVICMEDDSYVTYGNEENDVHISYLENFYDGEIDFNIERILNGSAFDIITTQLDVSKNEIYDITMTLDNVEIQPKGNILIKIPVPEGYDPTKTFVYYVGGGGVTNMNAVYSDGYMCFYTNHFSNYALVELNDPIYSVTWIIDGAETKVEYAEGETIVEPEVPSKSGYTFSGWTPDAPSSMPAYNLTFIAIFEKTDEPDEPVVITYTVKWVVDGNTTMQTYKEGDRIVKPVNPSKSGYTFKGWTPDVPSTMPAYNMTFTAVFEKNADPVVPSVPTADIIKEPSTTTISYGDAIILHIDSSKIPAGGRVEWSADNGNFKYTADGETCRIDPNKSGSTTFTATIYDAQGNAVSKDEQSMTSKAGFFDKFIAFFKKLFGLTKTIPQAFKTIF